MKKIINIGFLLMVLFIAVPAYADGDMTTGNKNCASNCGLYGGTATQTVTIDKKQNESVINEICLWIYEKISQIAD